MGDKNVLRSGSMFHSPKPSPLLLPPHSRWQYEVISARHSCRIYLFRTHHANSPAVNTGSMRVSTVDNVSNSRSNRDDLVRYERSGCGRECHIHVVGTMEF